MTPQSTLLKLALDLGAAVIANFTTEELRKLFQGSTAVRKAIKTAADHFSTRLPGAEDALRRWAQSDAFIGTLEGIRAGTSSAAPLADADLFIASTGIGLGQAPRNTVAELLGLFYRKVREELLRGHEANILLDDRLARSSDEIHQRLDRLPSDIVKQLATEAGLRGGITKATSATINTEVPPVVEKLSHRLSSATVIRQILERRTWYAMYGGSGTGKTQLAILLSESLPGEKVWIRLRSVPAASTGFHIDLALDRFSARDPRATIGEWYGNVCNRLENGAIVLDDLPRAADACTLEERLAFLCKACSQSGCRIITTSAEPLSPSLRSLIGDQIHEERIPAFQDDEIREIFIAHGAPSHVVTSQRIRFIKAIAREHPVLLVQAAQYLRLRNWSLDDQAFEDLLCGKFISSDLDIHTIAAVERTVPNEQSRELLYRLKLIIGAFDFQLISEVAAVEPNITLPLEKLTNLVGLWVQQDSTREFLISPLIARLHDCNVAVSVQQKIHATLASRFLDKSTINATDATDAIYHLIKGNNHNKAASLFLVALNGMRQSQHPIDTFPIAFFWATTPLPYQIDHDLRICIRCAQILLHRGLDQPVDYLLRDLDSLLEEQEPNGRFRSTVASMIGMLTTSIGQADPIRAARYIVHAFKMIRGDTLFSEAFTDFDFRTCLLKMLWFTAPSIQTEGEVAAWLKSIEHLPAEDLRKWARVSDSDWVSQVLCDRIWVRGVEEHAETSSERTFGVLEHLRQWAQVHEVPSLVIHAVRGQIIVLAEYQGDMERAVKLAQSFLHDYEANEAALFWIGDILARQYDYRNEAQEALGWFQKAVSVRAAVEPTAQLNALVGAGVAAHSVDTSLAVQFLTEAANLTTAPGALPFFCVQAWGELAIAKWSTGDVKGAYAAWSTAVKTFIQYRADQEYWKILFQIIGNCTGYFLHMRQRRSTKEWQFVVPTPGVLLKQSKAILEQHDPAKDWLLPGQLALLAEATGAYEEAVEWASTVQEPTDPAAKGLYVTVRTLALPKSFATMSFTPVLQEVATADAQRRASRGTTSEEGDNQHDVIQYASYAAHMHTVAMAFEIARLTVNDPEGTRSLIRDLADNCRGLAQNCDCSFLNHAADAFTAISSADQQVQQLHDRGVELSKQENWLQALFYLAAMLQAPLAIALKIQLSMLPRIDQVFSKTLYHYSVEPFIADFWSRSIDRQSFRFGAIRLLRSDLEAADALQGVPRVKAVLRAVAFSLGSSLQEDAKAYLHSEDPDD